MPRAATTEPKVVNPLAGRASVAAACLALALAAPAAAERPHGCPVAGIEAFSEHLPEARRFVVDGRLLEPLLTMWPVAPDVAAHLHPDAATLFARSPTLVLVALTRAGCVVGAYEAEWAAVLRGLRETLGPAV